MSKNNFVNWEVVLSNAVKNNKVSKNYKSLGSNVVCTILADDDVLHITNYMDNKITCAVDNRAISWKELTIEDLDKYELVVIAQHHGERISVATNVAQMRMYRNMLG